MRSLASLSLFAAFITLGACKGAEGPAGPQGAQGPVGQPGPAGVPGPTGALNRADFTGLTDANGAAVVSPPAAAFATGKLPFVACYVSSDGLTWLSVAQTPSFSNVPFCGLSGTGVTSEVVLVHASANEHYDIVVGW